MPRTLSTVGLVLLIGVPAPAWETPPDCPEPPTDSGEQKRLAGAWFARGARRFDEGAHSSALDAFLCSNRILQHPATLYNASQAAISAGKIVTALELMRSYLDVAPDGEMAPEVRAKVAEMEAELEKAVPREEKEEPSTPLETVEPEPAAPPEDGGRDVAPLGYVTLGVGAAALLLGGVLQAMAGAAQAETETTTDYDVFESKKSEMQNYQKGAVVGFIVGGVAVGAGVIILVARSGDDDEEVSLVPTPGGAALVGSF